MKSVKKQVHNNLCYNVQSAIAQTPADVWLQVDYEIQMKVAAQISEQVCTEVLVLLDVY